MAEITEAEFLEQRRIKEVREQIELLWPNLDKSTITDEKIKQVMEWMKKFQRRDKRKIAAELVQGWLAEDSDIDERYEKLVELIKS